MGGIDHQTWGGLWHCFNHIKPNTSGSSLGIFPCPTIRFHPWNAGTPRSLPLGRQAAGWCHVPLKPPRELPPQMANTFHGHRKINHLLMVIIIYVSMGKVSWLCYYVKLAGGTVTQLQESLSNILRFVDFYPHVFYKFSPKCAEGPSVPDQRSQFYCLSQCF